MVKQQDVIVINGPVVVIHGQSGTPNPALAQRIIYSVQLANGLIVTSPENFPDGSWEPGYSQPLLSK